MLRIYVVIVFVPNPIQYMFISSSSTFSMQKRFPLNSQTPPLHRWHCPIGGQASMVGTWTSWFGLRDPRWENMWTKRGGYLDNLDHPTFFFGKGSLWVHSLKQVSKCKHLKIGKKEKAPRNEAGLSCNHPFLGANMLVSGSVKKVHWIWWQSHITWGMGLQSWTLFFLRQDWKDGWKVQNISDLIGKFFLWVGGGRGKQYCKRS